MRYFRIIGEIVDIHQNECPDWIQVKSDDNKFIILIDDASSRMRPDVGVYVDVTGEMREATGKCLYRVRHQYDYTEFVGSIRRISDKPIEEDSDEIQ